MASTEGVVAAIKRAGGVDRLPEISGQLVSRFSPVEVAAAIEREVVRSVDVGFTKITIHMGLADAMLLAAFLRR